VAMHSPDATVHFGFADGELSVEGQGDAEGVSGAIACARALAARSDPVTGVMEIPPSHDGR
jgi:hypothetical protein